MTKIIKNNLLIKTILIVVLSTSFLSITNAATLNTSSQDYPTLQVANYTRNSNCSTCWSNSVLADAGDIITFKFFYHNASNEVANGVAFSLDIPSISFTSQTISGQILAQNAPNVYGSVQVNLTSDQTISLIPGEVYWYDYNNLNTLPLGQNGNEILTSSGLIIDDVYPGTENSGYILARARVSNNSSEDTTPTAPETTSNNISTDGSINGSNEFILLGSINANNDNPIMWFEYGTNQYAFINSTPTTQVGLNFGRTNFEYRLPKDNLLSNTTYYFRTVARIGSDTIYGNVLEFTIFNTQSSYDYLPTVMTMPASLASNNSSNLNAIIDTHYSNTNYHFEYGTARYDLINRTSYKSIDGFNSGLVSTYIEGLMPDTDYYFRIVATDYNIYGETISFRTPQSISVDKKQPVAITTTALFIDQGSAIINGNITPNNLQTYAWFEWSEDPNIINNVSRNADKDIGSTGGEVYLAYSLANLTVNKTYYFRVVAENSYGISYGDIHDFITRVPSQNADNTYTPPVFVKPVSANGLITIGAEFNKSKSRPGKEVIYTVNYKNDIDFVLKNAVLKIELPNEVEYKDSSFANVELENNMAIFDIGDIIANDSGSVSIKFQITELAEIEVLKFNSSITYTSDGNSGTENLVSELEVTSSILMASAFDILGGIFDNPFVSLLFGILIGFGIYHFVIKKKRIVYEDDPLK
jgi:hypothetical protein